MYLTDTVHCLIDPNHQYNPEVVEFLNTIEHLDGESTVLLEAPCTMEQEKGESRSPKI